MSHSTPERPIDPPEGEFELKDITDQDLMDKAHEVLDKRLEKGGLCELIDEITSTCSDMEEFEANLWAYLKENDQALRYIGQRYVFRNTEKLENILNTEHIADCVERRDNP